ncbi:uncharacterized protein PITG_19712 [Phytophthora infestans T30-4]|uniref:BED-type domain-containing protein n=1 Tax=Phytophthora infestans (strain T30-4) TaxID=403677 RepID=D0P0X9_PHYIT|nr:uncharacterized protein PITG_19712 [Phytophthora infestans T30-4]EEY53687.1 conserved hypothetical protein [Phytophthora infestans T30-4]|eukprot:XP_002896041.1 conserved hypothetical protein [Phytophthora infestans T30-4]
MSSQQLAAFFYTVLEPGLYRCNICEQPRKQAQRPGYTNLISHLNSKHPTHGEEYAEFQRRNLTSLEIFGFVDETTTHISAAAGLYIMPSVGQIEAEMKPTASPNGETLGELVVNRPPMQNSTRKRQKEELTYLRNKVHTLEQELETRRQELMTSKGHDKENNALTVQIRGRRGRAMRWQRIAKHQLVEKQRAELQNLQLRASLVYQLKLARSLQKLLKKNASRKDGGTDAAQLQTRLEFSNYCTGTSEDSLVCRSGHSLCQTPSHEEGSGVSSLHVGETEALYLEATNSKVVPFRMEETCSAVWRCLSKDHLKLADGTYHGVATSPDTIRAKAVTALRVDKTAAHLQMRFAIKKYVEPQRVVITLQCASESEGPRDLLHGLKMMQRAWVVIRPVLFEDGDDETIIQLCMRLTPSLSARVLDTPGQRTGAITELLLAAVHRNLGWLFQTVENILMEHNFGNTLL